MRYAIISDVHANYSALKAVVDHAQQKNTRFWFLGDLVGYGPARDARDCLQWLRFRSQIEKRWVPGNHDEWIINGHDRLSKDAMVTLCSQRVWLERPENQDDWRWYKAQVKTAITPSPHELGQVSIDERRSLVVEHFPNKRKPVLSLVFTHASIDNRRWGYLFPWGRDSIKNDLMRLASLAPMKYSCLIYGHTHFPALAHREPDGSIYCQSIRYEHPIPLTEGFTAICPGSVGQPRDGDKRAAYAIIDTDALTVEFNRVSYDIQEVKNRFEIEHRDIEHQRKVEASLSKRVNIPLEEGNGDGKRIYRSYSELIQAAYTRLIDRLDGKGGLEQQLYKQLYQVPEFDLESIDDRQRRLQSEIADAQLNGRNIK